MRRSTVATLAVALVLAVTLQGASAMRLPSSDSIFGDSKMRDIQNLLGRVASDDPNRRKEEKNPAHITIKFIVPPSVHDKFIDEWKDLEDEARGDKRNIMYSLGKSTTDNLYFFLCGEWETGQDAMDHFESKAFQNFKDFTEDNDIEWEFLPLKVIGNYDKERRHLERRGKGGSEERAHVLIKYHVPPSHAEEFEDAWLDLAEDTQDEKDNNVYALRKVATSNTDYCVYGSWESFNAFQDHVKSKHVRNFKDTVGDIGVVYFIMPVEKLGKEQY